MADLFYTSTQFTVCLVGIWIVCGQRHTAEVDAQHGDHFPMSSKSVHLSICMMLCQHSLCLCIYTQIPIMAAASRLAHSANRLCNIYKYQERIDDLKKKGLYRPELVLFRCSRYRIICMYLFLLCSFSFADRHGQVATR
jgi:hypothetical protein